MAITTFAELQTAVASWSHRTDLTSAIVDAITLCEGRLNDMLLLRDMESDEVLTLTANQNYVALPTGYISPIAFWIVLSGLRTPIVFVLPQQLPYNTSSSIPQYCAIDGDNIRFDCPASSAYSAYLRCIKKSNLSDSNTTNYLLTRRPDVYLAGTLVELSRHMQDEQLFNVWEPKFEKACAELKAAENRGRGIAHLRTDLATGHRSSILRGD